MQWENYTSPDVIIHVPQTLQRSGQGKEDQYESASSDDTRHGTDDGTKRTRSGTRRSKKSLPKLIFFITGNPGLIGYYHEFLGLLAKEVSRSGDFGNEEAEEDEQPIRAGDCVIAGFSLGGFEISTSTTDGISSPSTSCPPPDAAHASLDSFGELLQRLAYPPLSSQQEDEDPISYGKGIYSLQDQILLCLARIDVLTRRIQRDFGIDVDNDDEARLRQGQQSSTAQRKVQVLIMGHSVGAYIAMEVTRLWFERNKFITTNHVDSSSSTGSKSIPTSASSAASSWHPASLILLTPTILNISHSNSGKIATPILSNIPYFPELLQLGSKVVTGGLSESWTRWVVSKVTGMSEGAALNATVQFLRSARGVKQALAMARDEMREIGGDKWGDEVWGIVKDEQSERGVGMKRAEEGLKGLKLFLWFAKTDHWVADITRDEIVKLRGDREHANKRVGGPVIAVDESEGLLHAWCLKQNKIVAERVKVWITSAFA